MIKQFLKSLQRKGRKAETVTQYRYALEQFEQHLQKLNLSFFVASSDDIIHYYYTITQLNRASSTIYKRTRAVFSFYNWLKESGMILTNPAPLPVSKKSDAIPRNVPGTTEIKEAYELLYNSKKLVEQKDAVLLDLAYSCGIRREELRRLNVNDVDFYTGTIRIFGKGDRERVVPVGEMTLRNIRYYLLNVRPKLAPDTRTPALIISWQQGGKRMNKGSISRAFIRFRKRYHLSEKLSPHALRHAFATDLLRSGAPLQDVSKMLGHQKLETTEIYTRLTPNDLKENHRKYHPRG